MDGILAIEHNRQALKRILATLFAMMGLSSGGQFTVVPPEAAAGQNPAQAAKSKLSPAHTLPRHLYLTVLRLLRPAEAAARRLIIASARGLSVALPPPRPAKKPKPTPSILRKGVGTGIILLSARPGALPGTYYYFPRKGSGMSEAGAGGKRGGCARRLALPLLDPLPRPLRRRRPPQTAVPRISLPGYTEPFPIKVRQPPTPHDSIDATRLRQRLAALASALDDLPGQARRFARWTARRDAAAAQNSGTQGRPLGRKFRRIWPLRPGRPPGGRTSGRPRDVEARRAKTREIDEILTHSHALAMFALEHPDTS